MTVIFYKGGVLLDECSFAWTDTRQKSSGTLDMEQPALSDVSVDFPPGGLTGVVGLVGSGKSALLEAILGQLRCLQGNVYVKGSIAYLPQTACIFNMTIRDNVLFGKRMEPMRYRRVLEACDLARDLQSLPAGDLTEVGRRYLSSEQDENATAGKTYKRRGSRRWLDLELGGLRTLSIAKEVLQTLTVSVARLAVVGTQVPLACGLGVAATASLRRCGGCHGTGCQRSLHPGERHDFPSPAALGGERETSMTSVRCFDAVALICRRFYRLVDGAFKPLCAVVACVRFTRVTGGVAGFCVILASVLTVSHRARSVTGWAGPRPQLVDVGEHEHSPSPLYLVPINVQNLTCWQMIKDKHIKKD
ncbi:hypothetical protein HPB48_026247 [Haemaphysalis longicornis]|uniref:ABC transporter domain-containing protein n=1 Tax=Haemaphysalis longicornis TaxID=44386 RepID=A0A9J6H938_HAELO|nr:hypothetical protein HPB48_026247 [Haemaphysalis longicornis]